jgi:hypothetical protein
LDNSSSWFKYCKKEFAGAGTQTAGLAFGGSLTPGAITGATEEYDGSTWTTNPTGLNTAREGLAGCGTQTAALAFGGNTGSFTGATEEYNGSTWTNPTGLNTARRLFAGAGIQTSALAFGGGDVPPTTGATEEYDGSTWTTVSSLSTARYGLGGAGANNTSALAFGGSPPTTGATEEYNVYGEPNTFQNIGQVWYNGTTKALKFTDETFSSAWATGNNLNTARGYLAGAGTQTAGLALGGGTLTATEGATEEYDGVSWVTSNPLNTARYSLGAAGTQTAGLAFGGTGPGMLQEQQKNMMEIVGQIVII